MKIQNYILGFVLLLSFPALGQQEAQFSQYMFNNLFLNPAYAGVQAQPTFSLFHRTQWAGYSASFDDGGAPTTQVFSFNTPLHFLNSGAGLHIVNDKLGPLSNLEAQLSFAYHLRVNGGKGKLSLGGRGGIFSQTLNYDIYRAINKDDDPLLRDAVGKDTQIRPDIALGAFYTAEKYFVGISATRLLQSEFSFAENIQNPLSRNIYFTGGYIYELSPLWTITPSVLVKSDFNTYSFDVSALATYNNKFWGGLSYRQSDAAVVLLGMNIMTDNKGDVRLKAGYSFDYTVSGSQGKSPTSHEVFLSYALPMPTPTNKPQQKTPRYNH